MERVSADIHPTAPRPALKSMHGWAGAKICFSASGNLSPGAPGLLLQTGCWKQAPPLLPASSSWPSGVPCPCTGKLNPPVHQALLAIRIDNPPLPSPFKNAVLNLAAVARLFGRPEDRIPQAEAVF